MEEAISCLAPSILKYHLQDDIAAYLEDSSMTPLDGSSRAFVLFGVKSIPPLPVGGDLLIVVSDPSVKLADSRAKRTLSFPKLKSFDDNNDVVRWILREGEALNIDLSRVAGALFVNCGGVLRKLHSEISKIAVVTAPGSVASPDDVRALLCFSAELTPKYVVDSVCEGNVARAIAFYDKLQEKGEETGWILSYMQRHVVQQIRMEDLQKSGLPHQEVASRLGVHPFILKKMLDSRMGLWSRPSLQASLSTLCDLDLANRSGHGHARFCLELEIIRLAEEAHGNRDRIG